MLRRKVCSIIGKQVMFLSLIIQIYDDCVWFQKVNFHLCRLQLHKVAKLSVVDLLSFRFLLYTKKMGKLIPTTLYKSLFLRLKQKTSHLLNHEQRILYKWGNNLFLQCHKITILVDQIYTNILIHILFFGKNLLFSPFSIHQIQINKSSCFLKQLWGRDD